MEDQLTLPLGEGYIAHQYAEMLSKAVAKHSTDNVADEQAVFAVLHVFIHTMQMRGFELRSYARLEVMGVGVLLDAFTWRMPDDSVLVFGWLHHDEDSLCLGVLAPGADFAKTHYEAGVPVTLH